MTFPIERKQYPGRATGHRARDCATAVSRGDESINPRSPSAVLAIGNRSATRTAMACSTGRSLQIPAGVQHGSCGTRWRRVAHRMARRWL